MTGSELRALFRTAPQDGQRKFYDEYKKYVCTIVYGRLKNCGNKEDFEECVSDVFAEIFLNIERYYDKTDLTGVTGLIARRKAIQYYRRLSSDGSGHDELDGSLSDDSDIAEMVEKKESCQRLLEKIRELGEPDSAIILMSYYYDLNSFQIGARLSMKPATVRKRNQRALKKLKKLLLAEGIGEEQWI